jgi:hypothetical protein
MKRNGAVFSTHMISLVFYGKILVSDGQPFTLKLQISATLDILTEHLLHGTVQHRCKGHGRTDTSPSVSRGG